MPVTTVLDGGTVPVKIWTDDIDEGSKAQLANIASLPFIHHHVAAMPDVHLGIGATIGSVIATHQAIIPAAVGVDIGCGMVAARPSSGGVFELHQLAHGNGSDGICDSVHVSELDENMAII